MKRETEKRARTVEERLQRDFDKRRRELGRNRLDSLFRQRDFYVTKKQETELVIKQIIEDLGKEAVKDNVADLQLEIGEIKRLYIETVKDINNLIGLIENPFYREVMIERHIEEKPWRDIAEDHDVSERTLLRAQTVAYQDMA